jgi:hypothetical protein
VGASVVEDPQWFFITRQSRTRFGFCSQKVRRILGTDVMIKKNIFSKRFGEKLAFLIQKLRVCANLGHKICYYEKRQSISPKIGEIQRK